MKGFLLSLFVASLVLAPSAVFAQSVVTVEPLVDFSSVFSSLTTAVTTIVVGAITLGLGIWATRFIFSIVKSMGRG